MTSPYLKLSLLFVTCLSCASVLEPSYQNWGGARSQSANVLDLLVGDSRRMFANHFFAKADAYFHSGYYPTIFDQAKPEEESHLTGEPESEVPGEEHAHDENCKHDEPAEGGFLGAPKDWIDRFSRNFFPSSHSHLESGSERELLPWLRLSAQLDPQRVETYTIASYWLRSRLNKVKEAEQFLREGLRANPDSYEIYYELARIYDEDRHEPTTARNLYEVALRKWDAEFRKSQADEKLSKPNKLVQEGIVARLARLEENQGNFPEAIRYLKVLKEISPIPAAIEKQLLELQSKIHDNRTN